MSRTNNGNNHKRKCIPIDDAIEAIGNGYFQRKILLACGLAFAADAMEVLLLSFLGTILRHEWALSEGQVDSLVAVVFAGALGGTLVLGSAGDAIGRKPILVAAATLIAGAGLATAVCDNYTHLLVARGFVGIGIGGLVVPFDVLGEFLPNGARGKTLLGIEFFWCAGTLGVPLLAFWTLHDPNDDDLRVIHWRKFVVACSLPCFLGAIGGFVLVPESPRWLLERAHATGDEKLASEALAILRTAAADNGIPARTIETDLFPPHTVLVLSESSLAAAASSKAPDDGNYSGQRSFRNALKGFEKLFRTPKQTRTTLYLLATWFGLGFVYYGVILAVARVFTIDSDDDRNDGSNNYDDDQYGVPYYFDFGCIFLSSVGELAGLIVVLFTIDAIGRSPSQAIAYRVGGVATFALGVALWWRDHQDYGNYNGLNYKTRVDPRAVLVPLVFLARMATMGASCTTWVATSEMLATDSRSTGHGLANAMARLGGLIAPFVVTAGNSMVLFCAIVLITSLATADCAARLPETAGKRLGEVAAAVEAAEAHDGHGHDEPAQREPTDNSTGAEPAAGAVTSYRELL